MRICVGEGETSELFWSCYITGHRLKSTLIMALEVYLSDSMVFWGDTTASLWLDVERQSCQHGFL